MINHFDLFGLRQVYLHLKNNEITPIGFQEPSFYKYVRHPLMLGFIIAFWATPHMTLAHLVFSIATTGYIFVGIWFEERDLIRYHGKKYRKHRERVSMLISIPKKD
ncbi:methyltransferase family protein [Fodinibius salinus]|uniref:methyltransferase family protein n=1 Tax=Fodinibius salinus TaxID=860790 RepID=UPI001B88581F|nr:NnrU family protein [Fodinibius salinus]